MPPPGELPLREPGGNGLPPPGPRPRLLRTAYCVLLVLLTGCPRPGPDGNGAPDRPALEGVKLRLLVVDDPELALAVEQRHGEWNAQTGSEFQVESLPRQQLDDSRVLSADAVICPSYQLGPLAERDLLRPIPEASLQSGSADWADVFPLLRVSESMWGGRSVGIPFGSPVFVCYYRADLLEKLHRRPPETWAEYQELAELLADRRNLGDSAPADDAPWCGAIEPLGPGWAALVLLARAAPYAKYRDDYSTLLDIRTLEPLIAGPAFVRALEELVAAAKAGPPEPSGYDPTGTRAAFWRGQCGMALTWPTAAAAELPADAAPAIRIGFAELPGSKRVFNRRRQQWESRADDEDPHVPLLAVAGRIGAVTRTPVAPEPAWQLLFWLAGKQSSLRVSAASPSATLFRQSHVPTPRSWVEGPVSPSAATQYAAATAKALAREQWVCALRIPGREEYLAALDEAVRRAIAGEQSPAEALQEAAAVWRAITQRLGPQQQKNAYLHSLGREP